MKINKRGLDIIKSCEGCRLTAYKCPAGVVTIGYGHTSGVKMGDVITQKQANELLKKDIEIYENYVNRINKIFQYDFNRNEFSALVSFTYNCGYNNLLQLVKNGLRTKDEIANAIPLYNKAGGKVLNGLVTRRNMEKDLFMKGV